MAAFALRSFSDPDLLHTIASHRLIAFLLPWREYLAGRGLVLNLKDENIDCRRLADILLSPDAAVPNEMIDALYYVNETASAEDMDALLDLAESRGIELEQDPTTTVADIAIQMWIAAPEALKERHAETIAFRQKSFSYYGGSHGDRRRFPEISNELRLVLEAALDDWFEKHRRGRGCHIFFFPDGKTVRILVRHGLPMRREASHTESGEPATEFYRPQKHDVLVYDTSTDEMGVHADTKGEIKLYLGCLGRLVFGDEAYFPPADKFTLDPLKDDGPQSLACDDVEGLQEVRLVEYRRFWGGGYKEVEVRRAADIFAAFAARGQDIGSKGALVGATFKVKFADSPKERSVAIRPPGSARYERNEDSGLIESWLAKRGFILSPTDLDDDEAASETLELA